MNAHTNGKRKSFCSQYHSRFDAWNILYANANSSVDFLKLCSFKRIQMDIMERSVLKHTRLQTNINGQIEWHSYFFFSVNKMQFEIDSLL